jgi:glucosamine--fructose-6-phosphate aminotransferase (isomerizing)
MSHFSNEIQEQPDVLTHLLASTEAAAAAAELRSNPPAFIATAARGTSNNAAGFFAYLAGSYLGLPTGAQPISLYSVFNTQPRVADALLVGVSQSGRSTDVVRTLQAFSAAGARTLAVSNNALSPLAEAADWHLEQQAGTEQSVAATKTFTSQMFVLPQLVAAWTQNVQLQDALAAVPIQLRNLLEAGHGGIDAAAQRLVHASEAYLLGRGLSLIAPQETSLKLKETSYIGTQAYSSAEVQHGPIAAVSVNTPAIVFGVQDATSDSNLLIAKRLRELGADLTVVSSVPELLDTALTPIALPRDLHPVTEAFLHVVVGQLLSLKLVEARGLDPDQPRNLMKVTQTL